MASVVDIQWLKGQVGFNFSPEIDSFLTLGESLDGKLFRIGESGESQIRETLSAEGQSESALFTVWKSIQDERFAARRIPIAFDIGDNLILASGRGDVVWVDHESLEENALAESLTAFFDGLYEKAPRELDQIERLAKLGTAKEIEAFLLASPVTESSEGRSFAQESARFGNLESLRICRERGLTLEGCVHFAAMNDQAAAVKFLIDEAGVDVNEKNEKGWTPLQCVMFDDDLKKWLSDRGAV